MRVVCPPRRHLLCRKLGVSTQFTFPPPPDVPCCAYLGSRRMRHYWPSPCSALVNVVFQGGVGLHNPGIWLFVSLWPRFYVFWGHFSGAPALDLVRKYENQELNSKERLERVYCCKEVVVIKQGWMILILKDREESIFLPELSSEMCNGCFTYMYERI